MPRTDEKNTSSYLADLHLRGVSLLEADFTTHSYALHRHEAMVITTVQEGGAVITTRGCSDAVGRAHLYVCNPTEPHSSRMGRSRLWRFRSLYLTEAALCDVAECLGLADIPYFVPNVFADADLIGHFVALQVALKQGHDADRKREVITLAMGGLFSKYGRARAMHSAGRDDNLVRKVATMIEAEFARDVLLRELAETAGVSVWQLIGMFKRSLGMTPHAYLTQVRLNAVCRDLRHGMSIAEAAPAAGFYDQSALTGHFKKRFGITPMQFVAANQATAQ